MALPEELRKTNYNWQKAKKLNTCIMLLRTRFERARVSPVEFCSYKKLKSTALDHLIGC